MDPKPRDQRRRQQANRSRRQGLTVPHLSYSISNLAKLANKDLADKLRNDLNTEDDSKRTVKSIDVASANQIFSIFGLKDPGCDKNKDGQITDDELGCLGKIWKNYVPK